MPWLRSAVVVGMGTAVALGLAAQTRAFDVGAGIAVVAVSGATPDAEFVLLDAKGTEAGRGHADAMGSLLFHDLEQGKKYAVRQEGSSDAPVDVKTLRFSDAPPASFYRAQQLQAGFQYIQARDGTLLAAMVRPPVGQTLDDGPFPTVVEYSGYPAADPDNPQASTLIASFLGFATVGVNMRGSGCSGGVFDLFDWSTTADGYDIVETVAAQPWAQFGKVGMVGISFPGISQVFVGGARPPHLAAVAPLSVISDIYRAPGFPGGIFNNGFAQTWLQDRKDDAAPAPDGGQGYAKKRVMDGDAVCLANQSLRLQTQDPIQLVEDHPYYDPPLMDQRSPINWVNKIKVPAFFAGAWQDEQTGPGFADMLGRVPRRRNVKISVTNGVHTSSLDPEILVRWHAFLEIYVARAVPDPTALVSLAPLAYAMIFGDGAPVPPMPDDAGRFAGFTDLAPAKKLFEGDPFVRVLFENGAGAEPGIPAPTFEAGFKKWPPKETEPRIWYFGANGALLDAPPSGADEGTDSFAPDPTARPMQTLPGTGQNDSWAVLPPYDWEPLVDGTALAYATPVLGEDVTIVGPGSVDLSLRSSAADTDLQVTLSEIRDDGQEMYVQSGWLRASHRALAKKGSTLTAPIQTHLEADAAPMPASQFVTVRVGLAAVAHVFRAGSRIRISIEAPGGDRTRWAFDTPETGGTVTNDVDRHAATPSRLVLPVIPGIVPPPDLPPCPSLRGQPCREYFAASNGG